MYTRVYVEITNICNMNCSFCHGHAREKRQMSEAEFLRVLEQLEGKTEYIYYHLMGEPLTHPLLPRFLHLARERGFRSVITTNGTLLSSRGEALLDEGVHKISVSLHSFEGESGRDHTRYLGEIADFADTASKRGTIVVLRLWNKGFDGGRNAEVLELLHARFPEEWRENTRGFRIRQGLFLEWGDRFVWPDKDAPDMGDAVFCYGLSDHFGILADGSVVPCCLDSDGCITLGKVFEEELTGILNSPRARAIAEGFAERRAAEALCRRCGYARRFSRRIPNNHP